MGTAGRLVATAPILAALAWAGAAAVDVFRADGLVRDAATEMSTWSGAPAPETWSSVQEKLVAAASLLPGTPTTHELLGMLGTMRHDSQTHMDQGIAQLVTALSLRPVSPYTWAHLAEARYGRGEPVRSLEMPLAMAARLGPAEPGVQRMVADYGLAIWREAGPETRAAVDRMIAAGMRRNPLEMLRISDRRGRLEAACRHAVGSPKPDPRVGRYCERWEITP